MKRWVGAGLASGLAVLGAVAPAGAHHSFAAAYDLDDPVTIEGVIVEVRLTNPHAFFFLDVRNEAGDLERWEFEAGTPSGMIRNGYSPDVIKTGDAVTIRGFRAYEDDATNGMLRELVTADGAVYGMFGPREGPGAR